MRGDIKDCRKTLVAHSHTRKRQCQLPAWGCAKYNFPLHLQHSFLVWCSVVEQTKVAVLESAASQLPRLVLCLSANTGLTLQYGPERHTFYSIEESLRSAWNKETRKWKVVPPGRSIFSRDIHMYHTLSYHNLAPTLSYSCTHVPKTCTQARRQSKPDRCPQRHDIQYAV